MFIEFQLSTDRLLTIVRNQMRERLVCITDNIPPFNLYVDHIEVPTASGFLDESAVPSPAGFVRRSLAPSSVEIALPSSVASDPEIEELEVRHCQAVIPIQFHLTSDNMLADGTKPLHNANTIVAIVFTLWGEMDREEDPWKARLRMKATDIDFMGLDNSLSEDDKTLLRKRLGKIGAINLPISLGPLKALLGDPGPPFTNVGTSINVPSGSSAHATRLAVRWEIGGPADSKAGWDSFHNSGTIGSGAQGTGDWSLKIPETLVTTLFKESAAAFLKSEEEKPEDQQKFEVLEWPSTSWIWWVKTVSTTFDIDITTPGKCPNDVGVTVTLNSVLGPASNGDLEVNTHVQWEAYDADVGLCAALTIGALGDPTAAFTTTVVAGVIAAGYDPKLNQYDIDVTDFDCKWLSSKTLICSRPVPAPMPGITVALTSVLAEPDSAILAGTIPISDVLPIGPFLKVSTNAPFNTVFGNICESFDRLVIATVAQLTAPAKFCMPPEVVEDSLNQFRPFLREVEFIGKREVRLEVPESAILQEYLDNPYPCRVRLRSEVGAGLATTGFLHSPPPLPPPVMLLAMREQECGTYTNWPMDQIEVLPQTWWTDPPPDGAIVEYEWQILVTGLEPGLSFGALDSEGRLIGISTAGAMGIGFLAPTISPQLGADIALITWPPDGQ